MKMRHVLSGLILGLLALFLTGCSHTCEFCAAFGPNYYDPEGARVPVVSISDTNYPALLRGKGR